jgi:recombination protein RecA
MDDLDQIIKQIDKDIGEGLINIGDVKPKVEVISTGSIAIDRALGIGGFPKGRIVEIFGPEMSGKTTIILGTIAHAQSLGVKCVFIDVEHALDMELARGCGVDTSKLLVAQPNYGEQGLDMVEAVTKTGKVGIVVVDTVAALVPKKELDGEMIDIQMAEQARMMGKGLRKIVPAASNTNTIVIFINQVREKIGMYGGGEVTPGGRALKFAASIRIDARKIDTIVKEKQIIGNRVKVKVVKNKLHIPYKVAEFDLIFGKGVNNTEDIIKIGCELGIVEKKGASYFIFEDVKANGMENFIIELNSKSLFSKINDAVRLRMDEKIPTVSDDEKKEE